jgi:hypothetical protein
VTSARCRSAPRSVSSLLTKQELVLPIAGVVFVAEALSVILQVSSQSCAAADLPHGADSPSLRAAGLAGTADHRALLDRVDSLRCSP